ncbi:alpha/beta fold hydrolase [Oscillochloris sp. ZM17-4]|uniref:alpha/beta fold hydrolase n=1 Tax=Oscillochloris sp. ZM17-4 TaxID=2866714 RepID=UPI001C73BB0D|nr:alpha/beta fold hydrolase [Oscillochloris sp. ZM17-4]MBX0329635.1 alpha/beta fold hydrolase [Oscillochloris sp. ZM17-4]
MNDMSWIDRQEYPFASHYLDLAAGRMHFVDEGQGQPILMLHGNPTWSFLYRHIIKHLSPRYRCVAPDHIGFGLSDKPADWSYQPADHVQNIVELVEHLGLRDLTIVVQDWGGPIGMAYALQQRANVRRLIILNTWCWPVNRDLYYIAFSSAMGGVIGRWLIRRYNYFVTGVMRRWFGDSRLLTPEIHRHYLQPLARPEDRKGCMEFPRQIIAASPWLDSLWSRRGELQGLPVLLAWGMKDMAFRRSELARWQELFPEAEVVEFAQAGHFVQEEAPQELNAAVDRFLAH